MRLAIGGPTRDTVPASFAVDVAQLYSYTREHGPWGSDVTVGFVASTYIHVGREWFLDAAIKQGATHVLWLDTDMSVPRETAVLLFHHETPQDGVHACNYRVRQESGLFTACVGDQRVSTTAYTTGLQKVDYVGMGVMLMRTDVVAGLGRPWFRHGLNEMGGDIGEDVLFCRGLTNAGHTIYIDHDLSKEVGHIGQHTYRVSREAPVPV
jgi:hypothetical protein